MENFQEVIQMILALNSSLWKWEVVMSQFSPNLRLVITLVGNIYIEITWSALFRHRDIKELSDKPVIKRRTEVFQS